LLKGGEVPEEQFEEELVKFLQDCHGMEQQSMQTLQAAVLVAGDPQLESLYQGHIMETEEHLNLLKERLDAHDAKRSIRQDLAGRLTAAQLGAGVVADSDTPAKLVAVAYGFEHFEIAMYELLKRVAERAGDGDAMEMCDRILVNERQAAAKLEASYDLALERSIYGAQRA
jgi:ferritin-like metal-binding protein YciE